jgi:hypothetical protein
VECAADGDEVPQVAEAVEDLIHLTTTVGERRCARNSRRACRTPGRLAVRKFSNLSHALSGFRSTILAA